MLSFTIGAYDEGSNKVAYREVDCSDWEKEDFKKFLAWYKKADEDELLKVVAYLDFVDNDIWDAIEEADEKITLTSYSSIEDYVMHVFEKEMGHDVPAWLDDSVDYQKAWDALQDDEERSPLPYQIEDTGTIVEVKFGE